MSTTTEPAPYIYRMTGGDLVHANCREHYTAAKATAHFRPSIEAALFPGYPVNRLQVCAQCGEPIWGVSREGA